MPPSPAPSTPAPPTRVAIWGGGPAVGAPCRRSGHWAQTQGPYPPAHPSEPQPASMPGAGEHLPHHDPTPAQARAMTRERATSPLPAWPASPAPQKPDFASKPTREAWRTHLIMKRRPSLPAPLPLSGGIREPVVGLSPGSFHWVALGDQGVAAFWEGRGAGGGAASWVTWKLLSWEPEGVGRRGRGGAWPPQLPNFAWCLVEDSVTWLLTSARGG